MSSVATAMLVGMVGEAGGLELDVLVGGAVLGVLLGGVARLGCSCGLVSNEHRVSGPVAIGDVDGVRGFLGLGIDPTHFGVPSWDNPITALVTSVSWAPTALRCSPTVALRWSGLNGASARVRFVGMVEVGGPLRFVSTPSSARCRDRNASFSHEFMTSWVTVSKPCREGLAV